MVKTRSPKRRSQQVRKVTITIEEVGDEHHAGASGDRVEDLLETLIKTIDRMREDVMADIAALEAAVTGMEQAEVEGVEELKALTDEISTLVAGEVSQEKIDLLTSRATAATTALTAGVEAAKAATAPPVAETPAEPPAGETPAEPPAGEPPAPAAE
jgi:hypothetical protein